MPSHKIVHYTNIMRLKHITARNNIVLFHSCDYIRVSFRILSGDVSTHSAHNYYYYYYSPQKKRKKEGRTSAYSFPQSRVSATNFTQERGYDVPASLSRHYATPPSRSCLSGRKFRCGSTTTKFLPGPIRDDVVEDAEGTRRA